MLATALIANLLTGNRNYIKCKYHATKHTYNEISMLHTYNLKRSPKLTKIVTFITQN
jgi:hypothetical protein